MFDKCQNIDGHELENWKFSSKLKIADYMFAHCENLNCDLSKWDFTHIKNMKKLKICSGAAKICLIQISQRQDSERVN